MSHILRAKNIHTTATRINIHRMQQTVVFLVSQNNSHYGQRGCVMDFITFFFIIIAYCYFLFIRCCLCYSWLVYGFKNAFFSLVHYYCTIMWHGEFKMNLKSLQWQHPRAGYISLLSEVHSNLSKCNF